jgi:hypothetical protein
MNLLSKVRQVKKPPMDPKAAYGHQPFRTIRDGKTLINTTQSVDRSMIDEEDYLRSF